MAEYHGFHLEVLLGCFGISFLLSFSIKPFLFPSIFSTLAPAYGSRFLQQVPRLLGSYSSGFAQTLVDESGGMTQSWFLMAGFALNCLALRSFFSSKKRVRSHCWMLFLSGEAADLCYWQSEHKASLHLFVKLDCTGEGTAGAGLDKGIANACIPFPNKENIATE